MEISLLICMWLLAGLILISSFEEVLNELTFWQQVTCMLILTVCAPAIWITTFAEELMDLIIGEENDDGEENL